MLELRDNQGRHVCGKMNRSNKKKNSSVGNRIKVLSITGKHSTKFVHQGILPRQ